MSPRDQERQVDYGDEAVERPAEKALEYGDKAVAQGELVAQAPQKPARISAKVCKKRLFVVKAETWSRLPRKTRLQAEGATKRIMKDVGVSVSVEDANKLPAALDFCSSIVVLLAARKAPMTYVVDALEEQRKEVNKWLKLKNAAPIPPFMDESQLPGGELGTGAHAKYVDRGFAFPFMAGAVRYDSALDKAANQFIDETDEVDARVHQVLSKNRDDPFKWPARFQERLGLVLGRLMAHEARHQYIGGRHASSGLGIDGVKPWQDVQGTASFSKVDIGDIKEAIADLRKKQGRAKAIVPTLPSKWAK